MYEDTGYASYQYPILQPDEQYAEDGEIAFSSCGRADACTRICELMGDVAEPIWDFMRCEECDKWEAMK